MACQAPPPKSSCWPSVLLLLAELSAGPACVHALGSPTGGLFVHIPKTGGHSIDALLALAHVPSRLCHVPPSPDSSQVWKRCSCSSLVSIETDGAFTVDYRRRCGRQSRATFTMLRDPATRAISEWNHHTMKRSRGSAPSMIHPLDPGGVLHTTCSHDPRFCSSLADPTKCRLRGSCGLFQNHQVLTLAGTHGRTLPEMVSLERNNTALLLEARTHLMAMTTFGLTEHMRTSLCLIAHTIGMHTLFSRCCTSAEERTAPGGSCAPFRSSAYNARPHQETKAQLDAAESVNALDRALYVSAAGTFWRRVQEMEAATGTSFGADAQVDSIATAGTALHLEPPQTVAWAAATVSADKVASSGGVVVEQGLAVFAIGPTCLQEAFKSARSAKESYGEALHVTLLTDTAGVAATRSFSSAGVFDRAVSVFGRVTLTEEETFDKDKNRQATPPMNSKWNLLVKIAKQMAIATAIQLYARAVVFTDSDTFHCDNRTLVAIFRQLAAGYHMVTASPARNSKSFPGHDDCEQRINHLFTRPIRELNSGVLGFRSGSHIIDRLLQRWRYWYNDLLHTDCGRSGQDQKAFRFAVAEAQSAQSLKEPGQCLRSFHFWNTSQFAQYTISMQPFNCRVRARDDANRRIPDYTHCSVDRFKHCSLLHGHTLAMRNTRVHINPNGTTARKAVRVFLHIPKSAGASIKTELIPWLDRRASSLHINTAFTALSLGTTWQPPGSILYGAFASSACSWLLHLDRPCQYFTMLREPIDRMISELNFCMHVKWVGDQTCTGPEGAAAFEVAVLAAFKDAGPEKALLAFAEARGNVLVEHVGGALSSADFHYAGMPDDWHNRDPNLRVNPIEVRRRRQGPANRADLEAAKFVLEQQYVVVGFTDTYNESVREMALILAPGHAKGMPANAAGHAHVHDHTQFKRKQSSPLFVSRATLSPMIIEELKEVLSLDILLYQHARNLHSTAS